MTLLNRTQLLKSPVFKTWVKDESKIWAEVENHEGGNYLIIEHVDTGKFNCFRFFLLGNSIHVSQDHTAVSRPEAAEWITSYLLNRENSNRLVKKIPL